MRRRNHKTGRTRRVASVECHLVIERIGHRGDGVAAYQGKPAYVPYVLPGEQARVSLTGDRGALLDVHTLSRQRQDPVCRHFGTCGGCQLQHWQLAPYLAWKRDQVVAALAARGIETDVAPVMAIGAGTRRRAVVTALGLKNGIALGFLERGSHQIIDIEECPILLPDLAHLLPGIRRLLKPCLPQGAKVKLVLTESLAGADLAIDGAAAPDSAKALSRLVSSASDAGIARLTWNGEPLLQVAAPVQDFGGVAVVPPPGAFLQASRDGEAALWQLVHAGTAGAAHVADLFAGCGTFSLRLARQASVSAIEGDTAALAALAQAARQPGLKAVIALQRDLFKEPLLADELAEFDAVVFDPPFAGAAAQAEQLAASTVARIVAVSCNPATFARDARLLIDGGYRLQSVTPVDQFIFSPHIELVACFVRG